MPFTVNEPEFRKKMREHDEKVKRVQEEQAKKVQGSKPAKPAYSDDELRRGYRVVDPQQRTPNRSTEGGLSSGGYDSPEERDRRKEKIRQGRVLTNADL